MEALTQSDYSDYNELFDMDDSHPLDNYSFLETMPSMCTNDLFEDLMKVIVKAIMEKVKEENKQFIIENSMLDRVINCYSYFNRCGFSNVITDDQYCRRMHLPIINFIADKAVQAITHNKFTIDNNPEFEMLCKECKIDDEQMDRIKKPLRELTFKLDYIDNMNETM